MKIVLRSDIDKVGKRGDIVDVSDGFARNYLIPRGQAFRATEGVTAQATAMRTARDRADVKVRESAEVVAQKLVGTTLTIKARSGAEGKLFGSITNQDIIEALNAQTKMNLERKQIELHTPIKDIGTHAVPVKLHSDVHVSLNVEVVSDAE